MPSTTDTRPYQVGSPRKPVQFYDEKLSDAEAMSYIEDRVDIGGGTDNYRRPLERGWFTYQADYAGRQNFTFGNNGLVRPRRRPANREKYIANLILPKVHKAVSKVLSANAEFGALPQSDKREDLQAAKQADLMLRHQQRSVKWEDVRQRAAFWAAICGSGFYKVHWDPWIGKPIRHYLVDKRSSRVTLEPLYDSDMAHEYERKGLYYDERPGDVRVDVPSPFKIWWDPNSDTDFKDCVWAAEVSMLTMPMVRHYYGDDVAGRVSTAMGMRTTEFYERQIRFLTTDISQPFGQYGPTGHYPAADVAMQVDFYEIPLRQNGNKGRHIREVGKVIVNNDINHYAALDMPLPFVKQNWFTMNGRFIGLGLVEQLKGPQRAYNNSRAHVQEFQKTQGYGRTFLPRGCGIKTVNVGSSPGQMYEINASVGGPITTPPPSMPAYIGENAAVARSEMDLIAAQTAPDKSAIPSGIRSAQAVGMIQSENNATLAPTVRDTFKATEQVGSMILKLIDSNYTVARKVVSVGPGNEYEVRYLSGADLRGHTQVEVISEPGVLDTPDTRQAKAYDAVEMKLLDPSNPEHAVMLWRMLNFQTSDEIMGVQTMQSRQEEGFLQRMLDDPQFIPEVRQWNDPVPRMLILEKWLNSREFDAANPEQQQKIIQRWTQFSEVQAQRMQQQLELQAMMQGAPSQKGEASQPKS